MQMPQILEVVKKNVMGDSLGTCGGTWCVRGPRDGKGYVATLILTTPPPPGGPHFGRGSVASLILTRAPQLFGRLAVVEPHTLWYFGHHCCLVGGFDALGMWHFFGFHPVAPISTFLLIPTTLFF